MSRKLQTLINFYNKYFKFAYDINYAYDNIDSREMSSGRVNTLLYI